MYEKKLWSKKGSEQPFFIGALCDLLRSQPLENNTGHSKRIVLFTAFVYQEKTSIMILLRTNGWQALVPTEQKNSSCL
jgi:hypothetical protein